MNFGDYLKSLRCRKKISLRDLSKTVDIGFSYLSEIENSKKAAPNDKALLTLASALELSSEEMMLFFDLAAESKGQKDKQNYHIPADIGKYIEKNDEIKENVRKNIYSKSDSN